MTKVDEILEFWFGKEDDPGYGQFREEWFAADPEFDEEIRNRFLKTHEEARAGRLDHWQQHPRSALALVILLDQFSRNMFRGSPRMYDTDARARSVAGNAVKEGLDQELPAFQRWFLYMPFMHSEDPADQRRSVELFRAMGEDVETNLDYAIGHKETIERFGRFPHRNEILGRESTPEEVEFLE